MKECGSVNFTDVKDLNPICKRIYKNDGEKTKKDGGDFK